MEVFMTYSRILMRRHNNMFCTKSHVHVLFPMCTIAEGTPSDGVPIEVVTYIHYAVMAIGMMMGVAGLVYVALCLAYFIYYRNNV